MNKNLMLYTMRLMVEILTGILFYIQLDNNATVADLKREIEAQQELPQDRLIMFLDNNQSHLIIYQDGDGTSLIVGFKMDLRSTFSSIHFTMSLLISCSPGMILSCSSHSILFEIPR